MRKMKNSYNLITKIGETIGILFLVNVLWFMTVFLGLGITVGAANTAAFTVAKKLIYFDEEVMIHNCISIYFKAFKENFKNSTILWCITIIVFSLVQYNLQNSWIVFGKYGVVLQGIYFIVLTQLIFMNVYCYGLLSYFDAKIGKIIYSSILIANTHLFTTFTCLAVAIVLVMTIRISNCLTVFILISTYIYVTSLIFKPIFKRYSK